MPFPRPSLRRRRLRDRPGARATIAILASIGANVALLWFLASAGAFDRPREPAAVRPVALAPLSARDWAANRAVTAPTPRGAAPAKPQAPVPQRPQDAREVVELPPGAADAHAEPPPSARYLSDRDRRVEKETVSKYAGNYSNLAEKPEAGSPGRAAGGGGGPASPAGAAAAPSPKPTPQERAPQAKPTPAPRERQRPDAREDRRLALAPRAEGKDRVPDEAGLEPPRATEPKPTARSQEREGAAPPPSPTPSPPLHERPGEGVARSPGQSKPDLSVSPETLARIARGPGMAGYNQAEEGDITALNTRDGGETARWFMRFHNKLEPDWVRLVRRAESERDPTGEVFFYKERTVVVSLAIDPSGTLKDVTVLRSSNIQFFDEIAVASIRQAQPFEPPPATLFADGQARFAFHFTVYPARRRAFVTGQPLP